MQSAVNRSIVGSSPTGSATLKIIDKCSYRLVRSGHRVFIPATRVRIPLGVPKMNTTTRKVAEELFSIAPGDGLEEKYKTKSRKKKHESTTYVISVLK